MRIRVCYMQIQCFYMQIRVCYIFSAVGYDHTQRETAEDVIRAPSPRWPEIKIK